MLVDWLIYGLLTWGVVALLNATAFAQRPASRATAWTLTAVVFIVNLVAMAALQIVRYKMISQNLGIEIRPRNPLDVIGAFTFSWVFFGLLRKAPKSRDKPKREESSNIAIAAHKSSLSASNPLQPVVDKLDQSAVHSVKAETTSITPKTAITPQEQFWAAAITDFEGPSRRPGLWARAFAEAQGNESIAKANYLRYRAAELQAEHTANLERERRNAEAAQRTAALARLSSEQRAYAELPKGVCPKCNAIIPLNAHSCPKCMTVFGTDAAWKCRPISEEDQIAMLQWQHLSGKELTVDEVIFLTGASSRDKSLAGISDRFRGQTLLHLAAKFGLRNEVTLLLANGANAAAPNGASQKPFQLAEDPDLRDALRAAANADGP